MNTFKRYEKKYLLTKTKCKKLFEEIGEYIKEDKFASSYVCNLYYDTDSDQLIRSSIEKPGYKEKLRIRSYNVPDSSDTVFIEIKKKYDGIVYKRREKFTLNQANSFMDNNELPTSQIQDEISWIKDTYKGLKPKMYVAYFRQSYHAKDEFDLRITVDSNLIYRTDNLDLSAGIFGSNIIDESKCILEIKTAYAMPLWLCNALSNLGIYPSSFSKYGVAYKKDLIGGYFNA